MNEKKNYMRPVFYFIVLGFILFSCDSPDQKSPEDEKISIEGKWHRFSMENGYSEFDINPQFIIFYNQKVGKFKLEYIIENDSLKYLTHKYAAKIIDHGDSIFLAGNDNTTATLYRFKETDIPFDSIPDEKDSLAFEQYAKGFDQRLLSAYEKAGIQFFDVMEEQEDSTFQKLLDTRQP